MIAKLLNLFGFYRHPIPRPRARFFDHGTGWFWMGDDGNRIGGFMWDKPRNGDYVICPMTSGRRGCFRVSNLKDGFRDDPQLQFFADVTFSHYQDDPIPPAGFRWGWGKPR